MLIDKPAGWTSHDVVAVVRRQLRTRSVGHAGTLDPFATGLLVVLAGRATRLARFVEGMPKRYRAVVRFGRATDTHDSEGAVTAEALPAQWPDAAVMQALVAGFVGPQAQVPPAFSAKHVAGTRSHVLARRGAAIELAPVAVQVFGIELVEWAPPDLTIDAVVGRGTYLRALARDFGVRAGIPAHCAALRRLSVGTFDVADAVAPEPLTDAALMTPAAMLPGVPVEVLDDSGVRAVGFGRRVTQREHRDGRGALVASDGHLVAVGEGRDGWWHPVVVFEPAP